MCSALGDGRGCCRMEAGCSNSLQTLLDTKMTGLALEWVACAGGI